MSHLRYTGRPFSEQAAALKQILSNDPLVSRALELAQQLDLPDWMIVSGAIYNTVWNALTNRPSGYGIKDIDLFYCDARDLSWKAEDRAIHRARRLFADLPRPVEVRNQARVHLWFPARFGQPCPAYRSSAEPLKYFASKTHAVGIHVSERSLMTIVAPFGLDALFSFRLVPNPALANAATHVAKGERARRLWPEVTVEPWPAALSAFRDDQAKA